MRTLALLLLAGVLLSGCILFPGPAPTPTPLPTSSPTPRPTQAAECAGDADCAVQGCAAQWCAPAGSVGLPCRWNEWYACLDLSACQCTNGVCDWDQNKEFLTCRRANGNCPAIAPAGDQAAAACRMRSGEIMAVPDGSGCYGEPVCSLDVRCAKTADCPLGFSCGNGACRPEPAFCGGTNSTACPAGMTCVFGGSYYLAPGECRNVCGRGGSCADGKECVNGLCVESRDRGCEDTGCAAGSVCINRTCRAVEGMACAGPGASACPDGFYCVTRTACRPNETCMALPGTCHKTDIPAALSRYCGHDIVFESNPVNTIGVCANGEYRVIRGGNRFGYAYADGTIFRECGASAVNKDPACERLNADCLRYNPTSCDALATERFVYCPPSYSGAKDCPAAVEPVCARMAVGSVSGLRYTAWTEFQNGCLACNSTDPMHVPEGFLVGGCG